MPPERPTLSESECIVLDEQIRATMLQASLDGDATEMVALADELIARGAVKRSRGNVVANAWADIALRDGLTESGLGSFGLQLVEQGWCTDHDMEDGIAERLFVLGTTIGALPDELYDWMVRTGGDRFLRHYSYSHILRVPESRFDT